MDQKEEAGTVVPRLAVIAGQVFAQVEIVAYIVLGLLLAMGALLGIGGAGASLWSALLEHGAAGSLVASIDRSLFVMMVVEILYTVRVSFRSGRRGCEPFLVVGLIACIRRILVITLESSQAAPPGHWGSDSESLLHSTMLELGVLGGLILIMVISIYLLRRTHRFETFH